MLASNAVLMGVEGNAGDVHRTNIARMMGNVLIFGRVATFLFVLGAVRMEMGYASNSAS